MRFSDSDVRRFAEWSGDCNPLHVDPDFAQRSYFGRTVVHGMLAVAGAINEAAIRTAGPIRSMEVEFRGAIVPDTDYRVDSSVNGQSLSISVHDADTVAIQIRAELGVAVSPEIRAGAASSTRAAATNAVEKRAAPADRSLDEIAGGLEISGVYSTPELPNDLLDSGRLTAAPLRVLGLCSYLVGMEAPGLRSLFTRLRLTFTDADGDTSRLHYRLTTTRCDRQFRILEATFDATLPDGTLVATGELQSYVRFSPAVSDLDELARRVAPRAGRLEGKVALVIGGSRGLGADLASALAFAGCHVYASCRSGAAEARELVSRLAERGRKLEILCGDAADPTWCASTVEALRRAHGRLDLLVLNACGAPAPLRLAPETTAQFDRYISQNLPLARTPLLACLPLLAESSGAVACISSSVVEGPIAGFPHYLALKQAVEATVRAAAHETRAVSFLMARPPRLQTAWNDTPAAAVFAIPVERAAAHIVTALSQGRAGGEVAVLSKFPAFPADVPVADQAKEVDLTVGVAATFTAEPLVPAMRFWFTELGLSADVDIAPYGQVLQELLNPASGLSTNKRGINVVLLRVCDWLRELPDDKRHSADFVRRHLGEMVQELEGAVRVHRAKAAVELLLVVCPSPAENAEHASLFAAAEARLGEQLAGVPGLQVVVASEYHTRYGVEAGRVHDPLRDKLAHVPYHDPYLHTIATIVVRNMHRRVVAPRKVVVVDCDNTLWGGVVGEAGPEGIEIEPHHRALHAELARLSSSGVLVCLCSKNEESDVWRVFETRADFGLKREQIVAAMINWQPKSDNLRELASRLNLGLDSFLFLDDNPVECAEVRIGCPDVLTLEWPQDPDRARRLLEHAWELDAIEGTKEDQRRTQMYREEFRRQELRDKTHSFSNFLASLELVVDIAPLTSDDLKRASQLTLRTNQFNFTTRRRDESAMQALMAGGRHDIRTVSVRDRFGDYGLVGLLIAELQDTVLGVDTLLLSCRVLGRGVEHRMAAELGRIALAGGRKSVRFRVERTKRNAPAWKFLESITPAAARSVAGDVFEAELESAGLAALQFQPGDDAPAAAAEGETGSASSPGQPYAHGGPRAREARIVRAAFELATPADLQAAIEGRAPASSADVADADDSADDVTETVYETFAAALNQPVSRVRELDLLESLGCDSFKIVEITVALLARFPSLPSTLLFEHRSVAEIAKSVCDLVRPARQSAHVSVATSPVAAADEGAASTTNSDVAVVGIGLRCAGASTPDEFWELLSAGKIAVREVPAERDCFLGRLEDTRRHFAGLLDGVASFDAEFFGISPREAELMDPQLRIVLETAWTALEDAGFTGNDDELDTGVYVGVMYGDYGAHVNPVARSTDNPYKCWEGFSLPNRLSQILGFRGPSLAVDTACSSSGTALHLACRAILSGECRAAVVGGVNLILDPDRFVQLGRLGILSTSGKCQPFGAEADGTVLGEGAGVVVLRPLPDALRRGDRIYGIIKGSGLSTGNGTVGFTAPNPQAQSEAIRRCLRVAGVDPRTITYVETHGTGTSLGDPIEVRGLSLAYLDRAFWDSRLSGTQRCTIGSVKPNIGHLEAGAGILGLIKVLLQLTHGKLLPSQTSKHPNPQIPFAELPFDVQRTLETWNRPVLEMDGVSVTIPRRAGLSSFGVGGANAHLILEEGPEAGEAPTSKSERPAHLLTLSGRNEDSIAEQASRLANLLERHLDLSPADICFTANAARRHHGHRLALVTTGRESLRQALKEIASGGEPSGSVGGTVFRTGPRPRIACLFTGQGSQFAGMGRQFYESQPVFRDALDRCAERLRPMLDRPLLDLLFAPEGSPEARLLDQTRYTQPSLFAIQYALFELWRSWGLRPDAVMGHSVGEFAALCVTGGVSLDDGVKLIEARGRLMQALPAGGVMTSVMACEQRVREAIAGYESRVSIAAINGPEHVVISGEAPAVEEIVAGLVARGVRTKALAVSHAFHSPLMEPMLDEYAAVVRQIRFSKPEIPFVSGVHGRVANDEVTRPEYWIRQIREPVRFCDGMLALERDEITAWLEIGPHPVMLGMGRLCLPESDQRLWLPSLRRDADAWQTVLGSLGQLYVHGSEIDWKGFDAPYSRRTVALPAYPFRRERHWIEAPITRWVPAAACKSSVSNRSCDDLATSQKLYEVTWENRPRQNVPSRDAKGNWIILADRSGAGRFVAEELERRGGTCLLVSPGNDFGRTATGEFRIRPSVPDDYARLLTQIAAEPRRMRGILSMWGLDAGNNASNAVTAAEECTAALESATYVAQAVVGCRTPQRPALWLVTRGAQAADEVTTDQPVAVAQAPLWGFGRTLALEHADIWGGQIDLDPTENFPSAVKALVDEVLSSDGEDQIAMRRGARLAPRLVRRPATASQSLALSGEGTYLVTGGVGALGRHVAAWLVSKGARRLVLTSRRGSAAAGAAEAISQLHALGASVKVVSADIACDKDVERLMAAIHAEGAPLRGIVHAAGIDLPVSLTQLTGEQVRQVLASKCAGSLFLHERTRDEPLDFFVCFSSLASVLGAAGRSHYAAANAFLDALAHERKRLGLPVLTVNWGPWKDGGMANEEVLGQFERIGNHGLAPGEALQALESLLGTDAVEVMVADIEWDTFRAIYEARHPRRILAALDRRVPEESQPMPAAARPKWVSRLIDVEPERRRGELASLLRSEVAQTLKFSSPEKVDPGRTFYELGMDSLLAVEFANRIHRHLGVRSKSLVFDYPCVDALAARLLDLVDFAEYAEQSNEHVEAASHTTNGSTRRPSGIANGDGAWPALLRKTPVGDRAEALIKLLQGEVASILKLRAPDDVRLDRTFNEMGMDSLLSAELANRLHKRLGVSGGGLAFDFPYVGKLAAHLLDQLALAEPPSAIQAETAVATVAPADSPRLLGYSPELEPAIFRFCEQAWPERRTEWIAPRWRWMFVDSARRFGIEPRVWLYRDADQITAHMGAIPVALKVGSETHPTAWFVETMVLESSRSQALGSRMLIQSAEDVPFNISLGQTAEMREILGRLGWVTIAPLQTAQLLIRPERVLKHKFRMPSALAVSWGLRGAMAIRRLFRSPLRGAVHEVKRFDARHDRLWSESCHDIPCAVVRDSSYLNWKYVDQPGQDFLRLELVEGDKVCGVIVLMFRPPDEVYHYYRAFLVDLVAPLSDEALMRQLVWRALHAAADRGADSLICLHTGDRMTHALRKCGFILREPGRYLLVNPGLLDEEARRIVLAAENWYVTQGDSDIDRPW